ncbi:MAG: methylamine dehydrogenase accessory protein MauD [Pseudomonadota bacterium]
MSDLFLVSHVLLWIAVLALLFLVIALARQIGILHTRLAPAGALMTSAGPKVGAPAPELSLPTLEGALVTIGGPRTRAQLILFVAPGCPICKELLPAALSMARSERLDLVLGSDGGEPERHAAYVADMGLGAVPYVVSMDLGLAFEVAKLPYAALIDAQGVLRSKGLVNSREHLESLVEAMDSGFPSVQEYLVAQGELPQEQG